ncbi:hypothetical protein NBT05_00585 [Aquimarina sp. ERC-38]|uniref:hypothetical protein n=1 Tax=Aquimarina sp. ERC-38 TaxID=2949996 RepID=UPI0022477E3C|nr:hypothetical protein [Aquimarina sp. ERC-38]UZO80992.1 hypothetical protein NBT05_00585 [Aquimarina sp. ERC-38]
MQNTTTNWLKRYWKWIVPMIFLLLCIIIFFVVSQNAPLRYGSVYLQPQLTENARLIANKNKEVQTMFGTLAKPNFLNFIQGEVFYSKDYQRVAVSVKLIGKKKNGILDYWARNIGNKWEYDSVAVRIKKPEKVRIVVFRK